MAKEAHANRGSPEQAQGKEYWRGCKAVADKSIGKDGECIGVSSFSPAIPLSLQLSDPKPLFIGQGIQLGSLRAELLV